MSPSHEAWPELELASETKQEYPDESPLSVDLRADFVDAGERPLVIRILIRYSHSSDWVEVPEEFAAHIDGDSVRFKVTGEDPAVFPGAGDEPTLTALWPIRTIVTRLFKVVAP